MMRFWRAARLIFWLAVLGAAPAAAQTRIGPDTYEAKTVRIDGVVGTLKVETASEGPIEVRLDGRDDMLKAISVWVKDGALVLRRDRSLLDWPPQDLFKWRDKYPTVTLRLPIGTGLTIDGMIGQASVGNLQAPVHIVASALDGEIGDVTEASVRLSGTGDVRLGQVQGGLAVEIGGSGNVSAAAAGTLEITISGSGDVAVGPVASGVTFLVSGSGNITLGGIAGPVDGRINGSGNVAIGGGTADPLLLRVNGSGDFRLDGQAVDPDLAINGSGKVRLASYRGTIRLRGFTGLLRPLDGGGIQAEQ